MAKRFTDTDKYKKTFMRSLPGAYKLLWDYLYHDCNHAGIWHVDFEVAQIYLGKDMLVSPETALRLFNETEPRIEVLAEGKKWFIRPFVPFQYGTLNPANRTHKSVLTCLIKEGLSKGLISSLEGAKDKDKDKDMDKDKESRNHFTPPTPEEAEAYALTQGFILDGKTFCAHYGSANWMRGKTKITNWKLCVLTWKKNQTERAASPRQDVVI